MDNFLDYALWLTINEVSTPWIESVGVLEEELARRKDGEALLAQHADVQAFGMGSCWLPRHVDVPCKP